MESIETFNAMENQHGFQTRRLALVCTTLFYSKYIPIVLITVRIMHRNPKDPHQGLVGRSRYAAEKANMVYNSYTHPMSGRVKQKEYTMNQSEAKRFDKLYQRHLKTLKLQGKAQKTIDAYSRAIRRVRDYFDCCPDKLTPSQLQDYFADLVETHSWSTVMVDRLGLQHFRKLVLKKDWSWADIVKPP